MSFIDSISEFFKSSVSDYVELESVYVNDQLEGVFTLNSGALVSVMEIKGSIKHVGERTANRFTNQIAKEFAKSLQATGYCLDFIFECDPSRSKDMIDEVLRPSLQTMKRLELNLESLFEEKAETLAEFITYEKAYLVLTTLPTVLSGDDRKEAIQQRAKKAEGVPIKPSKKSQSLLVGLDGLFVHHQAMLRSLLRSFNNFFMTEILDHKQALSMLKTMVDCRADSDSLLPSLPTNKITYRLNNPNHDNDPSHIMAKNLCNQMFVFEPKINDKDMTIIEYGDSYVAPISVDTSQSQPYSFITLFDEVEKKMPWRMCLSIKTGHAGIMGKLNSKKNFAGFLKLTNPVNTSIRESVMELLEFGKTDTLVSAQLSFATWGDSLAIVKKRRESLIKSVQKWGGLGVVVERGDAIESWIGTMPMMTTNRVATPFALTLREALYLTPTTRPTSPWDYGSVIFLTTDGKIFPYHAGSSLQGSTAELIYAKAGTGKSFILCGMNLGFILSAGNTELPNLKIIDIGYTSRYFVELIREALPEHKKYQAQSLVLNNSAKEAINIFFTPLGCRRPLSVDKEVQCNMLELLLTPAGEISISRLPEIVSQLVDEAYIFRSDDNTPNEYEVGMDSQIDSYIAKHNYEVHENLTWWELTDHFMKEENFNLAALAQRFAMPLISDLSEILNKADVGRIFADALTNSGESLISLLNQMISSALTDYPIISQPAAIDISGARILSIDLQNVTKKGSIKAVKQTAFMFLLARSVACTDFYYTDDLLEEIKDIAPSYIWYYSNLINSRKGILSKLAMDEFHRTEGTPSVRNQAKTDIREGRKYDFIVSLLSQIQTDFDKEFLEQATTRIVLAKSDMTNDKILKDEYGIDEDGVERYQSDVRGITEKGSSLYFIADINDGRVEHSLNFKAGKREAWAYTTTPKDLFLRKALVTEVGLSDALRILSKEYPYGSAKKHIETMNAKLDDEKPDMNFFTTYARKLIEKNKEILTE